MTFFNRHTSLAKLSLAWPTQSTMRRLVVGVVVVNVVFAAVLARRVHFQLTSSTRESCSPITCTLAVVAFVIWVHAYWPDGHVIQ